MSPSPQPETTAAPPPAAPLSPALLLALVLGAMPIAAALAAINGMPPWTGPIAVTSAGAIVWLGRGCFLAPRDPDLTEALRAPEVVEILTRADAVIWTGRHDAVAFSPEAGRLIVLGPAGPREHRLTEIRRITLTPTPEPTTRVVGMTIETTNAPAMHIPMKDPDARRIVQALSTAMEHAVDRPDLD